GATYYYEIRAVDHAGNISPASETVNATPQASQSITFDALPDKIYGDAPFALTATASSGLGVSYSSSDPAIASVSGNTVTIHASGIGTIAAGPVGNAPYLPAADVQRTFATSKAGITGITFDDGVFTYDGTPKSIFITGVPPAGTDLSYSGNGQTNAGTYT